jgi:16S rRNA (adenine1518-N6/adenine1519-N6)-dimethyltransferase
MRAKKSLGQNFLQHGGVIEQIVDALGLSAVDTVIEIGPGRGALTEKLVERAGKVIAIEFDRDMVDLLRDRFGDELRVVSGDVLDIDLRDLTSGKEMKLVGNLPYNISTPILQRLIDHRDLFSTLVLMFQREVVDRINAKPGMSDRGYLSVLVEEAFEVERLFDVPPAAFRPVPKVWSAVVRLTPKETLITDSEAFRRLLSIAFAQKRKTIFNNLRPHVSDAADVLRTAHIDPKRRAETLTLDDWTRLSAVVARKHA